MALFLVCLIAFLGLDYFLPGKTGSLEKLDSIYTTTVKTSSGSKPTYDERNMVRLANGQTYRIGKYPREQYQPGDQVYLVRTPILGKLKTLRIKKRHWVDEPVSLLVHPKITLLLCAAFLISFANIFLNQRYLQIGLVASAIGTLLFAVIYILYF